MSKVLVIDDEALLRSIIAAYLEDDGHQVLTTANAESALTKLTQFIPDIFVVDLRREGSKGEEFIKAAAKLYPRGLYLIHTGCKDYCLSKELHALGIREHQIVFKPVNDLSRLSNLIDVLINETSPTILTA